jgi:hypothetical protein
MSELKYKLMLSKDMSWVPCYLKSEADKVIAEKDAEIAAFKAMAEEREKEIEFMHSNCKWYAGDGCARLHGELMAAVGDVGELKAEIESLKASHYAEILDAGMRERRLRRALYKACANWAHEKDDRYYLKYVCISDDARIEYERWRNVERKCLKKVEEYR